MQKIRMSMLLFSCESGFDKRNPTIINGFRPFYAKNLKL